MSHVSDLLSDLGLLYNRIAVSRPGLRTSRIINLWFMRSDATASTYAHHDASFLRSSMNSGIFRESFWDTPVNIQYPLFLLGRQPRNCGYTCINSMPVNACAWRRERCHAMTKIPVRNADKTRFGHNCHQKHGRK